MEMKQAQIVVRGRVQGVFFRTFVRDHALAFGVLGHVKNLSDGSVEVLAQGQDDAIKKLISFCKSGSLSAKVEDVSVTWVESGELYKGFEILY